ncbi:UNVERIFIED_CONTAM: hypothetical protein GTU68_044292 [Idotea baltica]|nr:hypothetical protein [Idotea baltica]
MGAVSPVGRNARESWESVVAGKSGLGCLSQSTMEGVPSPMVCEVTGFDPNAVVSRKESRRMDRYQQLAVAAADEAVTEAGLTISEENAHRVGVIISSCSGGYQTFEEELMGIQKKGVRACSPFAITKIMPNGASALVAMRIGAKGPSAGICSACAASSDAIGYGLMLLRTGMCDVVVVGGAEAPFHSVALASFSRMGLLSPRTSGTPSPFCRSRDGLVMGEGAAVLVLETEEHAKKRGAEFRTELVGYGVGSDAHHITSPAEGGVGAARAMTSAMESAGVNAEDISYINAHGTGTRMNDAVETSAVKLALGKNSLRTPVSSTKSMTGHMMGATSALELLFCVMAIAHSIIPPTINFQESDLECDLDYVPNQAREARVDVAMSNALGFGGHNSVLVVKKT